LLSLFNGCKKNVMQPGLKPFALRRQSANESSAADLKNAFAPCQPKQPVFFYKPLLLV